MPLSRPEIPRLPGTGRGAAAASAKREPVPSHAKAPAARKDLDAQLKSSLDDLDVLARASTDSPLNLSISREQSNDGLSGFIPDSVNAALKRLQARLDALSALGMSADEAVDRGMIPGLALKRFEAAARKLQALGEVGLGFERGVELGLVEADHLEVYESMLAQFETLDTLGISYEEGVQMGFIRDGAGGSGLNPVHDCKPVPSPVVTSSTGAPSVASSLPSRQEAAQARQVAAAPDRRRQGGGFSFHIGPGGLACYCAGAADGVDEHEVA